MTYDEAALRILLNPSSPARQQAALTALAAKGRAEVANRMPCPECGDRGPHDDNGLTGEELSFCCRNCGTHWDAQ
jgi:hypothetical protein